LVSDDLLNEIGFYRSWVEYPFFSDHAPIFLQLELPPDLNFIPLSSMLTGSMIWILKILSLRCGKILSFFLKGTFKDGLIWKLQVLKRLTKSWYTEKVKLNKAKMIELEVDIKEIINLLAGDPTNQGAESSLRHLEMERNNILRQEEDQWRLGAEHCGWLVETTTLNFSIISPITTESENIFGRSKETTVNLSIIVMH
jgi:hypothetical protein